MKHIVTEVTLTLLALTIAAQAHADCQSDTDCKAGRVCVSGECTAPPPPASSSEQPPAAAAGCLKDTDCKGDRVCNHGACVVPATPATPATPAASQPAASQPATSQSAVREAPEARRGRSFALSAMVGPWFGGKYSVEDTDGFDADTGFVVRGALDGYLVPRFSMGAYVLYAHNSLKDYSDSSVSLTALGGTLKGVFGNPVGWQFRPGFAFAYQMMSAELSSTTKVDDIKGLGLAFIGELAAPFTENMNGLVQLSFISQPVGGNDDGDVTFAPMLYLAFGLEYAR